MAEIPCMQCSTVCVLAELRCGRMHASSPCCQNKRKWQTSIMGTGQTSSAHVQYQFHISKEVSEKSWNVLNLARVSSDYIFHAMHLFVQVSVPGTVAIYFRTHQGTPTRVRTVNKIMQEIGCVYQILTLFKVNVYFMPSWYMPITQHINIHDNTCL